MCFEEFWGREEDMKLDGLSKDKFREGENHVWTYMHHCCDGL